MVSELAGELGTGGGGGRDMSDNWEPVMSDVGGSSPGGGGGGSESKLNVDLNISGGGGGRGYALSVSEISPVLSGNGGSEVIESVMQVGMPPTEAGAACSGLETGDSRTGVLPPLRNESALPRFLYCLFNVLELLLLSSEWPLLRRLCLRVRVPLLV